MNFFFPRGLFTIAQDERWSNIRRTKKMHVVWSAYVKFLLVNLNLQIIALGENERGGENCVYLQA